MSSSMIVLLILAPDKQKGVVQISLTFKIFPFFTHLVFHLHVVGAYD